MRRPSILILLFHSSLVAAVSANDPGSDCLFASTQLRDHTGTLIDGCAALANKSVALYFAGEWCPLCRRFTPALRQFHERYNESVSIVFVSSDASREDADRHFQQSHGQWLQLAWDDPLAASLKKRHGVWSGIEVGTFGRGRRSGVPCVVVIDQGGNELSFLAGERFGAAALREWEPESAGRWPAAASIKAEL